MNHALKGALIGLTAALILASAITTASARTLSVSEQSFLARWNSLEFINRSVGSTIRCRITLDGSFHSRTLRKVEGSLLGAITAAIVSHPCTGGEAWSDNGTEPTPGGRTNRLPFHLTYEYFRGVLPNITNIGDLISRTSIVIAISICTGRYGRTEDNITTDSAMNGRTISSMTPVAGRNTIRLVTTLGGICPASADFNGASGPVTGLVNTGNISVLLI
jgi:hypothetical protein